jgi:hypothetical protein
MKRFPVEPGSRDRQQRAGGGRGERGHEES